MQLGEHLVLDFGDSGASSTTLGLDGVAESSGGEGIIGHQGSSLCTQGPGDILPLVPGSSDARLSDRDANSVSGQTHSHSTANATATRATNPYPDTLNPSFLSTSGHGPAH